MSIFFANIFTCCYVFNEKFATICKEHPKILMFNAFDEIFDIQGKRFYKKFMFMHLI